MRVPLATILGICTIGSLRCHAGSLDGPHISSDLKPPASPIETPMRNGHVPSDGLRKPEKDAAYTNWAGWYTDRINDAEPAIDSPTAALPVALTLLFDAR